MEELRGDSRINIVGDGEREERHASPGTAYVLMGGIDRRRRTHEVTAVQQESAY